jgi:hypothetical protein
MAPESRTCGTAGLAVVALALLFPVRASPAAHPDDRVGESRATEGALREICYYGCEAVCIATFHDLAWCEAACTELCFTMAVVEPGPERGPEPEPEIKPTREPEPED